MRLLGNVATSASYEPFKDYSSQQNPWNLWQSIFAAEGIGSKIYSAIRHTIYCDAPVTYDEFDYHRFCVDRTTKIV